MRASYVWISMWPRTVIVNHVIQFAILVTAFVRLRPKTPAVLTFFLLGLPVLGLASMPASWLLLEQWKWTLTPQFQPMRALLFVALMVQFLTAVAGVCAAAGRRYAEAVAWFAAAYVLPLQPVLTQPPEWARAALVLALAGATVLPFWRAPWLAPAVGVAAFFGIPLAGGVVNYPRLHTPELAQLSAWARSSTPQDAVFLFPDAARQQYPGIFRSEALRAVYVDWKGGGQVNYLKEFGEQWWFRWQQTVVRGFKPEDIPRYSGLGVNYIVLRKRMNTPPLFENSAYAVHAVR